MSAPAAKIGKDVHWKRWACSIVLVPGCVALACWYLTVPIGEYDRSKKTTTTPATTTPEPARAEAKVEAPKPLAWPAERLEGEEAKKFLYDALKTAQAHLDQSPCFTARFLKQERIRKQLGPVQTIAMKVRHSPFAVYLKYLAPPKEGREVIFAKGAFDDHMIAHEGGVARFLVPRLKVAPTSPLALADTRHPITDVGLYKLVEKFVDFRERDLTDPDAVTILDWVTDDQGRKWARSIHEHSVRSPERPFARVVLYDPETFLPHAMQGFDWPESGQDNQPLVLGESYVYEELNLRAKLTDADFDPANPTYDFSRF